MTDVRDLALREGHSRPSRMPLVYHRSHGVKLAGRPIGPTFLVLGREAGPVRRVLLELEREAMDRGGKMPPSDQVRRDSVRVAREAVVGWEDFDWDGEENVPFSQELWNSILDDADQFWWIADLVDRHINTCTGHFPDPPTD